MNATVKPVTSLARVLLVDDDPTSRLTVKTVLETCGYSVKSAASAAEAVGLMEENEYALVLSDVQLESPTSGFKVIAHARMMDYKPATAFITAYRDPAPVPTTALENTSKSLLIQQEDVQGLLTKVANLISDRATRRLRREMILAGA
jgi:CheY-like chemotaxis protein